MKANPQYSEDPEPPEPDPAEIDRLFREAVALYTQTRRARIPEFVDRYFSVTGSVRLHRAAFGWDVLRAPANLALALPHLIKLAIAGALDGCKAGSAAASLRRFPTQIRTNVEKELEWLIWVELLELPFEQRARRSDRDALGDILMTRPEVVRAVGAVRAEVGERRAERMRGSSVGQSLTRYAGARNAASEIATSLASAGVGGALLQQLTPTAYSLGPPLAALFVQQAAIAGFPLGAGLGAAWYGFFPPEPSTALVVGTVFLLVALSSVFAAFAGIVADPVQRAFGVHTRRLDRFVTVLGHELGGSAGGRFSVKAHYFARLFDVFEAARLAVRIAT